MNCDHQLLPHLNRKSRTPRPLPMVWCAILMLPTPLCPQSVPCGADTMGSKDFARQSAACKPRLPGPCRNEIPITVIASRFYQLPSGHTIALLLNEKWKLLDSDKFWWCNHARQSRKHPLTECKEWKLPCGEHLWG